MVYQNTNYQPSIFVSQDIYGWDEYNNRLSRYEILDGYYHNTAYHRIMTYSEGLKVSEKLYKHVRGVYNPTKRS